MLFSRWKKLMKKWGVEPQEYSKMYNVLENHYNETHRHYHNLAHIRDCLSQLDSVAHLLDNRIEVETAIWFHDVIYDTRSDMNEIDSATLCKQFLEQNTHKKKSAFRVGEMITNTAHHWNCSSNDEKFMIDIDLSILGADSKKFDEYDANIRKEYSWVDDETFNKNRKNILENFYARDFIFQTNAFRAKYEIQARKNLLRLIQKLN